MSTIRERIVNHWRELLGIERVEPRIIHPRRRQSLLASMLANRLERNWGCGPS